jgi:hypothetical protein
MGQLAPGASRRQNLDLNPSLSHSNFSVFLTRKWGRRAEEKGTRKKE